MEGALRFTAQLSQARRTFAGVPLTALRMTVQGR